MISSAGGVRLLALLSVAVGVLAFAMPARAQNIFSGPTVVPDRTELNVGERVGMSITGFESRSVIMSVCGNEGRRGSVDCDLRGSQAREVNRDTTPTLGSVIVGAPPVPCPCIIRVTSDDNTETAVAAVTIVGHPVDEVVEPSEFVQPLVAEIDARKDPQGVSGQLRSSVGGPTRYEVTVRVRNTATFAVDEIQASAGYTRTRYDDTRAIPIEDPGAIAPGATWEQVVVVEMPALTNGQINWRLDASGIGPSVVATDTTSQSPILLYVLAAILVIDVLLLLWRFIARRRRARRKPKSLDDPLIDEPGGPDHSGGVVVESDAEAERRDPQLVS